MSTRTIPFARYLREKYPDSWALAQEREQGREAGR